MDRDIFFDEKYGRLYEKTDGGECRTFVFHYGDTTIQNMFIMRPIHTEIDGGRYFDITTPYGYGGAVVTEGSIDEITVNAYYEAWEAYCAEHKIVSEFVRFHLFDNSDIRSSYNGDVVGISDNVVRYLDSSVDEMWMEFEHKVRKNVKKALSNGLSVIADPEGAHLDAFLDIYYETMDRNDARSYYYFDKSYFSQIIETMKGNFTFFHVLKDGRIISTELVLTSEKYVYSFLGGTLEEYYSLRPNDLLKYEIIKWAKETGHKAFILGGGYGGNDGIYRYKKSFAPGTDVRFYIGKKIHDNRVYSELCLEKGIADYHDAAFFPAYRSV